MANQPTPEQIASECLAIQETWSAAEFYVRAGRRPPAHLLPAGQRYNLYHRAAVWQPQVACVLPRQPLAGDDG